MADADRGVEALLDEVRDPVRQRELEAEPGVPVEEARDLRDELPGAEPKGAVTRSVPRGGPPPAWEATLASAASASASALRQPSR